MSVPDPQVLSRRDLAQGGAANAGGAIVASLAGLAVVLLAGRSMTPADYASFASVWGLVFGGAAILGALEQEVARVRSSSHGPVDRTQLAATGIIGVAGAVSMTVVVVLLFDELRLVSPFVAALVVASAATFPTMFTARGYLAGSMRLLTLSAVTVSEALLRLLVVLLGLWVALDTVPTFAVGALCGSFVGVPILLRHYSWHPGAVTLGATLRRTGVLMVGNAMSALLVTGAPVLVGLAMAQSSVDAVGRMQAAVVVSRFPLIALMLLQSLLVPVFVRRETLYRGGDYRRIVILLASGIPVAAIASYAGGRWLLSLLYGQEYLVEPLEIALLTTGATALGGIQVLIAIAVSGDRHRLSPLAFAPTLAMTTLLCVIPVVALSLRVPVAFACGPIAGFVVAVVSTSHWRRQRRLFEQANGSQSRG
jgi:O-antigen/teichoic acid export membrane protein